MVLGLALTCVLCAAFVWATFLSPGVAQTTVAYVGFAIGGLAAGFTWSSEGILLAQTVERVADATRRPIEEKSAEMAAIFGFWNLVLETVVKVIVVLLEEFHLPMPGCFIVALAIGVLATIVLALFAKSADGGEEQKQMTHWDEAKETLGAVCSLQIWLFSFISLAFTMFSAGTSVMNAQVVKPQLGLIAIGVLSAIVSGSAFLSQVPLSWISSAFHYGKVIALEFGALVYIVLPILALTLNLSSLGWGMILFYIGHGVGRGVFRGTYYAIIADNFKGDKKETAFGAVTMINAVGFTVAFLLAGNLPASNKLCVLSWITLALGVLVLPGYIMARRVGSSALELPR